MGKRSFYTVILYYLTEIRKCDKELARFISIAIGSMAETEYLLDFSKRLGYMTEREYTKIIVLVHRKEHKVCKGKYTVIKKGNAFSKEIINFNVPLLKNGIKRIVNGL